jgi:hypothetical protein
MVKIDKLVKVDFLCRNVREVTPGNGGSKTHDDNI